MAPATADPTADVSEVMRAVADPVRCQILRLLAAQSLCVCHLQDALGIKQTLVSHHLRALRGAGLVDTEPCGRFTYYSLRPGAFEAVRHLLEELATASRADLPRRPC